MLYGSERWETKKHTKKNLV